MGWNEPGGGNRDPWSGSGRDQEPPQLGAALKKAGERLRRLFGSSGRRHGGGGPAGVLVVVLLLVGVWFASGFYRVEEGRRGVELRLGELIGVTGPGAHWQLPYPLAQVEIVDVALTRTVSLGQEGGASDQGLLITEDQQLARVPLTLKWQVLDPAAYLFSLAAPEQTVRELAESALREAVNRRSLAALSAGAGEEIAQHVRESVQQALNTYGAGIRVAGVEVGAAQLPAAVQAQAQDVARAREEERKLLAEAEDARETAVAEANAQAARLAQEAEAYSAQRVAQAQGEAERFLAVYQQYRKAPQVTRDRMYIETLEQVLQRSSKALIHSPDGRPLVYLPLDKMIAPRVGRAEPGAAGGAQAPSAPAAAPDGEGELDPMRRREAR